jgi:hypothetical protein
MRLLTVALLSAGACALLADRASAVTMQFPVTRDAQIYSFDSGSINEQAANGGGNASIRTNRYNQNATIMDFNTSAMAAFVLANPGAATWTLHVNVVDKTHNGDVSVQTVESTNDWAEGDGNFTGSSFNWTAGTGAATYFYAETYYKPDPANPSRNIVDTALSKRWIDPDTANGTYLFTKRNSNGIFYGVPGSVSGEPTPQFTNSTKFLLADLNDSNADASVVIDPAIINALITDPNNRGLRFGIFGVQGTGVENDSNARINTREQAGKGAYLEVTIIPEPTSLMLLIGSVCCLAFRRR